MKRWYVIDYGYSSWRRLAENAREAVDRFLEGSLFTRDEVRHVAVETTGEVVPEDLWR